MSIVYAVAGVLILNTTVLASLTLMSVAKPWIVASPASLVGMLHWLGGVPAWAFSHTIGLLISGSHATCGRLSIICHVLPGTRCASCRSGIGVASKTVMVRPSYVVRAPA